MVRALVFALVLSLPLTTMTAAAATGGAAAQSASKTLTLNGEAVHDVGAVGLNVTNFGLIGSRPGINAAYSDAPSLEYPLGSGIDQLWAAALWIGGRIDGQARVSTGQFASELLADPEDPRDTVYASVEGAAGGRRLPHVADDDGDGLFDEDPLNGFDDDGDGLVDEDFAAIGDQYFHAQMRDDTVLAERLYPDHVAMGLRVRQESFAWRDERVDDLVGFRVHVDNVGANTVDDVFLGVFADFDIGTGAAPGAAENDLVGYEQFDAVSELDDEPVSVSVAYVHEGEAPGPYAGVVLLGQRAPNGISFGAHGFQHFSGNAPFDRGGDPNNDAERYEVLSRETFDPTPVPNPAPRFGDYRVLAAAAPAGSLAPGQGVVLDFALVVGADLAQLRQNAANAVALARGRRLGAGRLEWSLPVGDDPVVAVDLTGQWSASGARLRVGVAGELEIALRRVAAAGLAERIWFEADARRSGPWLRFHDGDSGPWPRLYRVVPADDPGQVLAELSLGKPGLGPRRGSGGIQVAPNPFNPRTEILLRLDEATPVRVEVFDARGRLVRLLADEFLAAGEHRRLWEGNDEGGRALSSGLYFVRVSTPGHVDVQRAVMVR